MMGTSGSFADNGTLGSFADNGTSGNESCEAYKHQLMAEAGHCGQLTFLAPGNDRIWDPRSEAWQVVFHIYSAVAALLFLIIGVYAVMLIFRKECIRMKIKTFFVVYTCIAVLCFSRFLLFVLDPFGVSGFIIDHYLCWVTISRFIVTFAFPSLVASYTLVFLTLLTVATAFTDQQWYQKWGYVIPITVAPYALALAGEALAHVGGYSTLTSALVCESIFTIWGVILSTMYLFAGFRLVRTMNIRRRKTLRSIDVDSKKTPPLKRDRKTARRTKKISQITILTAILGLIFSAVCIINLTVLEVLLGNCLGYEGRRGNSSLWLALHITLRLLEVLMALNLLYSVTDMRKFTRALKEMAKCHCARRDCPDTDKCTDVSELRRNTDTIHVKTCEDVESSHLKHSTTPSTASSLPDDQEHSSNSRED